MVQCGTFNSNAKIKLIVHAIRLLKINPNSFKSLFLVLNLNSDYPKRKTNLNKKFEGSVANYYM